MTDHPMAKPWIGNSGDKRQKIRQWVKQQIRNGELTEYEEMEDRGLDVEEYTDLIVDFLKAHGIEVTE